MTVSFSFEGDAPTPRDAATVLVVRDSPDGPEVFFVKRAAAVRFMGGAYVFPGGRLDPEDADPAVAADLEGDECARRLGEPEGSRARALYVAALRECLEESGLLLSAGEVAPDVVDALRAALEPRERPSLAALLAQHGVTLSLAALVPWSRWVTPRQETRRFDARFFIAQAPADVSRARHDGGETVESAWLTPREAIARARRAEIVLAPPTWRTLAEIADAPDVAALLSMPRDASVPLEPSVIAVGDTFAVLLPDDPEHHQAGSANARVGLPTRFVYRDGAWETAG
ncbi:MAG: NUDIX hydrolase [Deltaproteobacteria bacterium]|nr:NUDIX hydrolase [Deltaproteobacteria bacterium]